MKQGYWDVIIIGGGPAGLSTGVILGRARRKVLILDSQQYRNAKSHGLRGFLTRDGILPLDFLKIARSELLPYPSVELRYETAEGVEKLENGFSVVTGDGETFRARKLVLATGVVDILPPFENAETFLGSGLYHCPYCDGWENRDKTIVTYAQGDSKAADFALMLSHWSKRVILCTDGESNLTDEEERRLRERDLEVKKNKIRRLLGGSGHLEAVEFVSGETLACDAMFFNTSRKQSSILAKDLGCEEFQENGCEVERKDGRTSVPGLFIVGDASKDILQVIVAASEGNQAAVAINKDLLIEDGVLPG